MSKVRCSSIVFFLSFGVFSSILLSADQSNAGVPRRSYKRRQQHRRTQGHPGCSWAINARPTPVRLLACLHFHRTGTHEESFFLPFLFWFSIFPEPFRDLFLVSMFLLVFVILRIFFFSSWLFFSQVLNFLFFYFVWKRATTERIYLYHGGRYIKRNRRNLFPNR